MLKGYRSSLVMAFLVVLSLLSLLEFHVVSSYSMEPTLYSGDVVLAFKSKLLQWVSPKTGEVIIFKDAQTRSLYVKRLGTEVSEGHFSFHGDNPKGSVSSLTLGNVASQSITAIPFLIVYPPRHWGFIR